MITCDAFIAESCGPASFGRRNYFATNFGRRLFVPSFPYLLQATFVVVLRTPKNTPIEDLELTLTSSWGQSFTKHLGTFPAADREACHSIEWSRLDTTILAEGSFTLACEFKGYAWSANWQVISGVGPLRQGPTALPGAAHLDGRRPWNPLADLAREVRSSLFLADPYATLGFLESLLTPGPCP
jgi:hypothetical protein